MNGKKKRRARIDLEGNSFSQRLAWLAEQEEEEASIGISNVQVMEVELFT